MPDADASPALDAIAEAVRPWIPYRGDGLDDERVAGAAAAVVAVVAQAPPLAPSGAGQVMPPGEVSKVRDHWSGSVYEGAVVRLCDSHEALRDMAGRHDPTGADHMEEMWAHAQRADAAEAQVATLTEQLEDAQQRVQELEQRRAALLESMTHNDTAHEAALREVQHLAGQREDMGWLIGHFANNVRHAVGLPPRLWALVERCSREYDPGRFTLAHPAPTEDSGAPTHP